MGSDLGEWQPLPLREVVPLFADAPFRWWIAGGHALDLHLGTSWRPHGDIDIGVRRADADRVGRWLTAWDLALAADGWLTAWHGEPLDAANHHNNIWCRRHHDGPWLIDLTVGDGDGEHWRYRRDEQVVRPWSEAVLHTSAGVPYLAPELQLLFKSRGPRAKDDDDARFVIPRLSTRRREALATFLEPDHPWQAIMATGAIAGGRPAGDHP